MTSNRQNITFIGFGEAGQAFAKGLSASNTALDFHAYDLKTNGPEASAKRADYEAHHVTDAQTCPNACANADVIFSLVTADQAQIAAEAAAQTNLKNSLYLDCNSCAPNTKRQSAKLIEQAGGRYVDVAVMTPVHPKLHQAPCLLAGPHADAALEATQGLGMTTEVAGPEIGDASTRKMIRSVMIKGLEALTLECFLAAREAGIEGNILASLEASFPGFDWTRRAPYMIERAATHGIRRAAEMEEVAKTLTDLGLSPHMTQGTVKRQREVGELMLDISPEHAQNLDVLTDTILSSLLPQTTKTNRED